MLDRFIDYYID